jgi:hypothetical protein
VSAKNSLFDSEASHSIRILNQTRALFSSSYVSRPGPAMQR